MRGAAIILAASIMSYGLNPARARCEYTLDWSGSQLTACIRDLSDENEKLKNRLSFLTNEHSLLQKQVCLLSMALDERGTPNKALTEDLCAVLKKRSTQRKN